MKRMKNDAVAQSVIDEFNARFERVGALEAGWMEGRGEAVTSEARDAARGVLDLLQRESLALPLLYPTEEGGMSLEWWCEKDRHHITVRVKPDGGISMQHRVDGEERTQETESADDVVFELSLHNDLLGHTGSGVTDEEIHAMLECIAVAIEMTNGEPIERAERAGMAFLATWDAPARVRFAGELSVVAVQSLESRTARIFEAFLDSHRPRLETGAVDIKKLESLLAE